MNQLLVGWCVLLLCIAVRAEKKPADESSSRILNDGRFGEQTRKVLAKIASVSQRERRSLPEEGFPGHVIKNLHTVEPAAVVDRDPSNTVESATSDEVVNDEESRLDVWPQPTANHTTSGDGAPEPYQPEHNQGNKRVTSGSRSTRCSNMRLRSGVVIAAVTGALDELVRTLREPGNLPYFKKVVNAVLHNARTLDERHQIPMAESDITVLEMAVLQRDEAAVAKIARSVQHLSGDSVERISHFIKGHPALMESALAEINLEGLFIFTETAH